MRGRDSAWGEMVRRGFSEAETDRFGEAELVDSTAAATPTSVASRVSVRAKSGD